MTMRRRERPVRLDGTVIAHSWRGAIDDYLDAQRAGAYPATTVNARRQHLEHLARRTHVDPFELTPRELIAYAAAQSWMPETRRSRRNTLLSFYRWAIADGRAVTNPAEALPRVKAIIPPARPIPTPLYEAALRKADERTGLMLRLAYDAGLRRGEIAVVHSDDLMQDLDGWSLLVHGKGGKQRIVPLTRRLALDLRAAGYGYVFPGAIDGHLSPRRVSELAVDVLPTPWTIHTLRHSFGTRTHNLAGDTFVVQELLGHASPATTRRYVLTDRSRLRATVDAAAGYSSSSPYGRESRSAASSIGSR
ncbi:integrase [Labedella phragmitis]|uniref:Integrase n=1 Tax=Labedella phragmitis TaxID=2498849 RepID=A0A3S4A724_9MICO|nr:tyrosine-type recombinase/integrase [Labedella phragmitis]RWZ52945.1 integrase [Labedella phragmitis]